MDRRKFWELVDTKGAGMSADPTTYKRADVVHPVGAEGDELTPSVTEAEMFALADRLGFERPVHIGLGLWFVAQWVTPAHAARVLTDLAGDRPNAENRAANVRYAVRIATDIEGKRWTLTHQGIAFDRKGGFQDGQHRLKAIMDAGQAVPMVIAFNVSEEARRVIDTHQRRTAADIMTIFTGAEFPPLGTSIVRRAVLGQAKSHTFTNSQMAEFISTYMTALTWVMQRFPRKGLASIRVAPVLAALVRAFFHVNHKRLAEFISILREGHTNGIANPKAAVELRNRLTESGKKMPEEKRFLLTMRAIELFCNNEDTADLRVPRGEAYDLPGTPDYDAVWKDHGDPSEPLREDGDGAQNDGDEEDGENGSKPA